MSIKNFTKVFVGESQLAEFVDNVEKQWEILDDIVNKNKICEGSKAEI